ncbi:hypothetical protein GCM10018791_33260 [Streptomyces zaomyceticus]|nr:hypothetical protein GCM10018791_33260 [Streptomyces zaomyceticus]
MGLSGHPVFGGEDRAGFAEEAGEGGEGLGVARESGQMEHPVLPEQGAQGLRSPRGGEAVDAQSQTEVGEFRRLHDLSRGGTRIRVVW